MSKGTNLTRGGFWRPLAQYLISDDGRIRNIKTGRYLQGYLHRSSSGTYRRVTLSLHGRRVRIFVHRLVGIMWGQPPKGIGIETPGNLGPDVSQINHIDGNTLNNRASNLEWVSPADNAAHAELLRGFGQYLE
jgi:hypothetical protein